MCLLPQMYGSSEYGLSQWEEALLGNIFSHRLNPNDPWVVLYVRITNGDRWINGLCIIITWNVLHIGVDRNLRLNSNSWKNIVDLIFRVNLCIFDYTAWKFIWRSMELRYNCYRFIISHTSPCFILHKGFQWLSAQSSDQFQRIIQI